MKSYLFAIMLFISTFCYSQVTHVFSIGIDTYSVTFSKNDNNYEFDLSKVGNTETIENFTLPKLEIVTFRNVVYQHLINLNSAVVKNDSTDKKIAEFFYTVVANIDTIDDLNYAPIAGTLAINKEVNLYRDNLNKPSIKLSSIKFQIDNVQIVFQNGFIQDVIVDGKIVNGDLSKADENMTITEFLDAKLRFTNFYGIGFSSKKNIRNLDRVNLYPNNTNNTDKNFLYRKGNGDTLNLYTSNEIHINLGEVIESYGFRNDIYTTDYSPANAKVTIEGGKSTTLYKDKTYKILEARVFSDFLGFDSDKPNGLIQVEVEKQFNFNTTRYQFLTYKIRAGIGYVEYLKFSGGLTKIEDNNRFLVPDMQDEPATSFSSIPILVNHRYTTPIDVLDHQIWNIGVTTNIALLDMPLIKSQLHFNAGFRFAQTKVQDSLRTINTDLSISSNVKDYSLNYWIFHPEVTWHILPETRYGFFASWRPKYLYSISDGIEFSGLRNPLTGNRRENISNWINEFELLGYLYVNEEKQNGKLFVRWRLNSEMQYSKNNFSQFQVGYSFFILGRGKQN